LYRESPNIPQSILTRTSLEAETVKLDCQSYMLCADLLNF